jgi:glycosyltransferase involved in cell wall biosynthesis
MKKDLAVLLNSFWTSGRGITGGDQMAIQLFKNIHGKFTRVSFYSNVTGCKIAAEQIPGIRVVPTWHLFDLFPLIVSYLLRTVLVAFRLWKSRPDIIYSGSDFFPDVLPSCLLRQLRRDLIWHQCVFHIYPPWKDRPGNSFVNIIAELLQRFSLRLARQADTLIVINEDVKEHLIKVGFQSNRIACISPGVDLERPDQSIPTKSLKSFDCVYLGRLNFSKGVLDLPEIWEKVSRVYPEKTLAVVGSGSSNVKSTLMQDIANRGLLNSVKLLGFVEDEEAKNLLRNASCLVLPSYEEGFGIVIVEAFAVGTNVVAWNLPVYKRLFYGQVCTAQKGDKTAFANLICQNFKSPVMSRESLRKVAQKYTWKEKSNALYDWLELHASPKQRCVKCI